MSGLVRGLQERAARAQPVERRTRIGPWLLRVTEGASWWTGSVLPHGADRPLPDLVAAAQRWYDAAGATARYQVTPGVCPDGLDALLADRGLVTHSPMHLQTGPLAGTAAPLVTRVDTSPADDWFDVRDGVRGPGSDRTAERALLAALPGRSAYAVAQLGGRAVAVGRVVVDGGWAGLFAMTTLPEARGRGAARSVLAGLTAWAADQGATDAYLQVQQENAGALRLYAGAGFATLADYHYRSAPGSPASG